MRVRGVIAGQHARTCPALPQTLLGARRRPLVDCAAGALEARVRMLAAVGRAARRSACAVLREALHALLTRHRVHAWRLHTLRRLRRRLRTTLARRKHCVWSQWKSYGVCTLYGQGVDTHVGSPTQGSLAHRHVITHSLRAPCTHTHTQPRPRVALSTASRTFAGW